MFEIVKLIVLVKLSREKVKRFPIEEFQKQTIFQIRMWPLFLRNGNDICSTANINHFQLLRKT